MKKKNEIGHPIKKKTAAKIGTPIIVALAITVIKAIMNNGTQKIKIKDQFESECLFDLALVFEASKHQATPKHS